MLALCVSYKFHPVGQGLFSSGCVKLVQRPSNSIPLEFNWLYDCGSTKKSNLSLPIASYTASLRSNKLDMLIVSHFDNDHIIGVCDLLENVGGVDTLVLPWAPLWERLVIGFAKGIKPSIKNFDLLIDPIRQIKNKTKSEINQILLVPRSDPKIASFDDTLPPTPEPTRAEATISTKLLYIEKDDIDEDTQKIIDDWNSKQVIVKIIKENSKLTIDLGWEFIPHNDDSTAPKSKEIFKNAVNAERNNLNNSNITTREESLAKLKMIYESEFVGSKKRNNLSLFVYAGPVDMVGSCKLLSWSGSKNYGSSKNCFVGSNISILHTGDGSLKKTVEWQNLSDLIEISKLKKLLVLQVPHHGSKYQWHQGLAAKISPAISIYSSNPTGHYFHPHQEVKSDFANHATYQVDLNACFSVKALYLSMSI